MANEPIHTTNDPKTANNTISQQTTPQSPSQQEIRFDPTYRGPGAPDAQGNTILNLSALRYRLSQLRSSEIKSTGSRSTVSSVPVLVRSYSAAHHIPHPPPRRDNNTAHRSMRHNPRMEPLPSLPPVANFSFAHVLLTVDSDIQEPLDAISSICARSRYSLADEYGSHLPPQGQFVQPENRDSSSINSYPGRQGLFIRTNALADSALSVVHEASSSSAASDSGTMKSAYGSLRHVLSRRGTARTLDTGEASDSYVGHSGYSWIVQREGRESIVLAGDPQPSSQIITEPATEATYSPRNRGKTSIFAVPFSKSFGLTWLWSRQSPSTGVTAESLLRNTLLSSSASDVG
ncbi:hypothetical protein BT63DRAFT_166486 [Microthyrium microscopicum]|uniref:Uncharacterized protein n=1 Tax=Microthyrium microscopicum TaxID=703497 RepID=A0A6A6UQV6_9PEZI|nr:hypothetical protein BT63DRAFT_166486 [Microthyrium microscopicum]